MAPTSMVQEVGSLRGQVESCKIMFQGGCIMDFLVLFTCSDAFAVGCIV